MRLTTSLAAALVCLLVSLAPAPVRADGPDRAKIDLFTGWEFDFDGQGYAYLGAGVEDRLTGDLSVRLQAVGSYSYYKFNTAGRGLRARAPGAEVLAGPKYYFSDDSYVGVLMGIDYRNTVIRPNGDKEFAEVRGSEIGFIVQPGFDVWLPSRTNINGLAAYTTATKFAWGRLRLKQQVNNLDFSGPVNVNIGLEGSGAGNEDYSQWEAGPLVELYVIPWELSLLLRGGYKRSSTFGDGGYGGIELSLGL